MVMWSFIVYSRDDHSHPGLRRCRQGRRRPTPSEPGSAGRAHAGVTRGLYAAAVARAAFAAFRITSITGCGCDSMATWLLFTSTVVAPMRLARKRSRSGWTVRSSVATRDQLGFDFHAVPSTFWLNRSASGAKWVAQTTF